MPATLSTAPFAGAAGRRVRGSTVTINCASGLTTTRRGGLAAAGLGLLLLAAGCRQIGPFVWVDQVDDPAPVARDGSYVISSGDVVNVGVWNQDGMSARTRVRPDGMISLPFVNDVRAAGLEPPALAKVIQAKLKDFIVNPVVTISLEEPAPFEVSVVGEVARPGVYRLDPDSGVLKALASAGGLNDVADRDRIFVLRRAPTATDPAHTLRIRFTYEALAHLTGKAGKFRLRSSDVVVVE